MDVVPAEAVLAVLKQLSHDIRGAQRTARGEGWLQRRHPARPAAGAPPSALALARACRQQLMLPLYRGVTPLCSCLWVTCCPISADLDVGTSVDRHQKLAVVQFLRDYVAANKPVVLTSECTAASWLL